MTALTTVHMLWVKGELSRLARLSRASFEKQGFTVDLWSYEPGDGRRDAREITPYTDDMAALTSLFRYKLLAGEGGIWADMDVVALAGPDALPAAPFVASEKRRPFRHKEATATGESLTQVTNCMMGNPVPKPNDLWHRAATAVETLLPEERSWEAVGPHLLSRLMLDEPAHGVEILPPEAVDPVAWWNVPAYFLDARPPPASPFMHMYNSIWAKRGIDPEGQFGEETLIGRLYAEHGV
jgi:hypothetical protein